MKCTFLFLAAAMFVSQAACGAGKGAVSSAPSAQTNESTDEQVKSMKLRIKVGEKEATATLNDSEAARDFASLLPLNLTLEDYAKTEKTSNLPKKLSTEGSPAGSDPDVGDIAYFAPWGTLVIYYKDFGYSNGLVILGKIDGDMEIFNVPGSVKATIELIK
ncbi:MAG: cyclophilin-like fold protein [Acidobacteriota bacterium]